ncbi:unannotated protein [freshwater metagenome]|uniref:Unannotated protein n=1 Tax=freshwater metagenome TaxID=449393 RepID=A0A6J6KIB3_9ZZZZ
MASASGRAVASSLPYLSAIHPTATTAFVTPFPFKEWAWIKASIESFLALSMNPQVLITAISAFVGSLTNTQPSAANRPANSSESVSLRAHPRVTRATVRGIFSSASFEITVR